MAEMTNFASLSEEVKNVMFSKEFDEYVNLVCDFLEYIPLGVSIQRLTADGPRSVLLAPRWATQKRKIIAAIDAELERRNSHQGARL